jgi:tRNA/tmRNA/rRNA uracil-C5-methylase (TrmA/RlmC/RlmD family)
MVNIVLTSQDSFDEQSFTDMLLSLKLDKKITSVLCTINDSVSDFIHAEEIRVLYGADYIEEKCFDKTFIISPFSFYQTNSKGAEVLYGVCIDMLKDMHVDTLFDLYCGTGTIAQILAGSAKKVIGVEIIEEAVLSARQNAKLNEINNCEFICGDVLKVIDEIQDKPDIIVLDPPRSGTHPKRLLKLRIITPNIFYTCHATPRRLLKICSISRSMAIR